MGPSSKWQFLLILLRPNLGTLTVMLMTMIRTMGTITTALQIHMTQMMMTMVYQMMKMKTEILTEMVPLTLMTLMITMMALPILRITAMMVTAFLTLRTRIIPILMMRTTNCKDEMVQSKTISHGHLFINFSFTSPVNVII